MSNIINHSDFDPLIDYIKIIGRDWDGQYFMTMEVPATMALDEGKLLGVFADDCVIEFSRAEGGNLKRSLKGHIRDALLGKYLMDRKSVIRMSFDPSAFED